MYLLGFGSSFFHFSALPSTVNSVQQGDKLHFTLQKDPKNGKFRAANIQVPNASSGTPSNAISVRAFSMNMPFAALLANGYKTLESRSGTMSQPYPEGTQMLTCRTTNVSRREQTHGNLKRRWTERRRNYQPQVAATQFWKKACLSPSW